MRLLLDANLSPRLNALLVAAGVESVHVGDVGLLAASDEAILDHAAGDGSVVVTADGDFGVLLAVRRATRPSVVHLRHVASLRADEQFGLLLANLPQITDDLERGAIVSLSPKRLAVRSLPIGPR